jgi:hypothetical protein
MSQLPNHVPNFSNAQLEILKVFASNLSDKEMEDLHKTLMQFRAERLYAEVDRIWVERGYTAETMEEWLNDENQ